MLKIRTKLHYLVLLAILLALLAAPIGGIVVEDSIAGDDFGPALTINIGDENPTALAATCTGGSDGQCGG